MNIRYNPENDMIEIFYNGVWNAWKVSGMQSFDFPTDTVNNDWQSTIMNVTYASGVPNKITFTATSNNTSVGNSTINSYALCKTPVMIKKGDKLKVTCSGAYTGGNQCEIQISTNGTSFTSLMTISQDSYSNEVDLANYADKEVYIRVGFRAASVKPSKTFTRFVIEQ